MQAGGTRWLVVAALLGVAVLPAALFILMTAPPPASTDALLVSGVRAFRSGDYATAEPLFRRLALRNVAAAETLLGTMAANGQGSPRDPAVAAAWFLRAANRGYAPAQLALADALARGEGVEADRQQARALRSAAIAQGGTARPPALLSRPPAGRGASSPG